jgi:two-component system nitrogen regulation response regulator GlnG
MGFDVTALVARLLREGEPDIYRKVMLAVDRAVMQAVFQHTKGNQARASEMLGISRTTLRAKIRALRGTIKKQLLLETGQPE